MSEDRGASADARVETVLLDRLKQVLSGTNTIVWEVDLARMTADYFGPVEQLTGLPPEELDDPMDVLTLTVHEGDQSAIEAEFESLLAGEQDRVDVEYRTRPDMGPVRWIRTQAFVEDDLEDATLVGFSTDITRLKEKEARLDAFAGIVSHDLRNPLTVAKGRVELAREEREDDHLEAAARALDRMEELVEDVLSLARADRSIGELEHVTLADLVDRCWATVETREATVSVSTDRVVRADESRLRQLLENLFRNAIQHGGDDVTVTVGDLEDGFYVEDDGPGFPGGDGTDFFGGAASTSTDTPGIGLWIVKQVADAHDWEVSATTGRDGGARIEVTGVDSG